MSVLPSIVYLLCFATAALCTGLLGRAYLANRQPLLLWTGLCFLVLSLNNLTVFVDIVLLPGMDLTNVRYALSVIALGVLLYGFVWEGE
jgi:hypothetical protein